MLALRMVTARALVVLSGSFTSQILPVNSPRVVKIGPICMLVKTCYLLRGTVLSELLVVTVFRHVLRILKLDLEASACVRMAS